MVGYYQIRLAQNGVTYVKHPISKLNCEERSLTRLTFPENRTFLTGKSPYRKSHGMLELGLNKPLFFIKYPDLGMSFVTTSVLIQMVATAKVTSL